MLGIPLVDWPYEPIAFTKSNARNKKTDVPYLIGKQYLNTSFADVLKEHSPKSSPPLYHPAALAK